MIVATLIHVIFQCYSMRFNPLNWSLTINYLLDEKLFKINYLIYYHIWEKFDLCRADEVCACMNPFQNFSSTVCRCMHQHNVSYIMCTISGGGGGLKVSNLYGLSNTAFYGGGGMCGKSSHLSIFTSVKQLMLLLISISFKAHFDTLSKTLRAMQLRFLKVETLLNNALKVKFILVKISSTNFPSFISSAVIRTIVSAIFA